MADAAENTREFLLRRIREDLSRSQQQASRLGRVNGGLVTGILVTGAVTAGLAGVTAAQGPLVGQGPPAWRWTCGIVALISAMSTVLTGVHQRFTVAERLAKARACAAQLRALEFGLGQSNRDSVEAARQYEEILKQNPELND
jgi:hypothetical protein